MSTLIDLNTSATSLAGGASSASGTGEQWQVTGGGNFVKGDTITLSLTDSQTGVVTQIGAGNITNISPTFCYTYSNKVYMLADATAYFSAVSIPTSFNDPNAAGNGFITMSNFYATQEPLTAMAPYQGRLLFTSRRYTQIWQVDPDPSNYALTQLLDNIGTISPLSVQPVGDQDVYMLADNGVRSVRVRDASNNAVIADVGVPIDAILQPLLSSLTDTQKAAACGIVEPSSNRYWLYVPNSDGSAGSIYVFSSFPSSQVDAWSTYAPTVENGGTKTPFVPIKFITYQGQVWALDNAGKVYQYGGSNNNTYSNCGVTGATPYDGSQKPATKKTYTAMDCALEGTWSLGFSPDYVLQAYKSVYTNTVSSFKLERIPIESTSTHFSVNFSENGSGYARLSSIVVHMENAGEK